MARIFALIAALVLSLVGCTTSPQPEAPPRTSLVQDLMETTVLLENGPGTCAGVWVGPNTILTAAHCVEDTVSVDITPFGESKSVPADIVKVCEDNDLAFVVPKEATARHRVATLRGAPAVGEGVLAIGHP